MNTFFVNMTESLDLKKDDDSSLNPIDSENINDILEKHQHYPSVHEISQTFMANANFSFRFVTEYQVREAIINLDGSKATSIGDISVDILSCRYSPSIHNKRHKFINQKRLFSWRN